MSKKITAVFLPYKASMWDSLESVYKAASADPDCRAIVMPIPYYSVNPDKSLGQEFYEGDLFPSDIPVTDYRTFDLEKEHPDVIFIHNPYDGANLVTKIGEEYYSKNLKKYTDLLVYIPYYATSGGMAEFQKTLPVYFYVDHIVIQSEQYRLCFDERIPKEKFLPFGSPKFDSVINKCRIKPELPADWEEKMRGKKVFFYNTSIAGMQEDTGAFLAKMQYVFGIFLKHPEVCLLWRPHPLLEQTFENQRPVYKPVFDKLKETFIEHGIGIYDDTPCIEDTIALSDVYIGDAGTSVTSLFGVSGKPVFILNNKIHSLPDENAVRKELFTGCLDPYGDDRYITAMGNKLWYSENDDHHYRYICDLSEFSAGNMYLFPKRYGEKVYIFPSGAQDIAVWDGETLRKIPLCHETERAGNFFIALDTQYGYFLIPLYYPHLIRFTPEGEKVDYVEGIRDMFVSQEDNGLVPGGAAVFENDIVLASACENRLVFVDSKSLTVRKVSILSDKKEKGFCAVIPLEEDLWLLPVEGYDVVRFHVPSGESETYHVEPSGISCLSYPENVECSGYPYGNAVLYDGIVIFSPMWANMYAKLDLSTGEVSEWIPPHEKTMRDNTGYNTCSGMGGFVGFQSKGSGKVRLWHAPEKRLYEIEFTDGVDDYSAAEVPIIFDDGDVNSLVDGFGMDSPWQRYCLKEDAYNSLENLIEDNLLGSPFNKEAELDAYRDINASPDGDCGVKVYDKVRSVLY